MRNLITIYLLAGIILTGASARAQSDSDKLDIKKLEEKYWSAKDDDFSVVQNRAFTKAGRVYLSVLGGIPINDPNSSGSITAFNIGYYFNERWGVEGTYLNTTFSHNDATDQFMTDHGTIPNHNKLRGQMTVQANYVPLYAKMSFLDRKIIYFDMGVGFGLGQTQFDQMVSTGDRSEVGTHYMLSLFQNFFFSEHLAVKFDFRNTWTSEERLRYKLNPGDPESSRSKGSSSVNDTAILLGVTYFLGGGQ